MKFHFTKIAVFLFLLTSCRTKNITPVIQKLDFLADDVSKSWKLSKATVYFTSKSSSKDSLHLLDLGCEKNSTWQFYRNGTFLKTKDSTFCSSTKAVTGRWYPDDPFSQITLTNLSFITLTDTTNVRFGITTLTNQTLTLEGGPILKSSKKVLLEFQHTN